MEYRKKCEVCGKIFCYTDKDIRENLTNSSMSALSALGGLASIFGGGTIFHTSYLNRNTQHYGDKVVDYTKCPNCGSHSISDVGDAEWANLQRKIAMETQSIRRVDINSNATPEMLLKRAAMFLEDGEWGNADAYAEAVLDMEPENAMAYVIKLMAETKAHDISELASLKESFEDSGNYKKAIRFGTKDIKLDLEHCLQSIQVLKLEREKDKELNNVKSVLASARTKEEFQKVLLMFEPLGDWRDSKEQKQICLDKIEEIEQEEQRKKAKKRKTWLSIIAIVLIVFLGAEAYTMAIRPAMKRSGNIEEIANAEIGDTVDFGYLRRTKDIGMLYDTLDWLVLDKEDTKVLLVSKGLFWPCGMTYGGDSWKNSDMREWLNGNFYESIFNKKEKSLIIEATLDNGNDEPTNDAVFLLSKKEVKKYKELLHLDESLDFFQMYPYGKSSGGYVEYWWTRTMDRKDGISAYAVENDKDTYIELSKWSTDENLVCYRPALWIDLSLLD